jgi:hypothetical protein
MSLKSEQEKRKFVTDHQIKTTENVNAGWYHLFVGNSPEERKYRIDYWKKVEKEGPCNTMALRTDNYSAPHENACSTPIPDLRKRLTTCEDEGPSSYVKLLSDKTAKHQHGTPVVQVTVETKTMEKMEHGYSDCEICALGNSTNQALIVFVLTQTFVIFILCVLVYWG